MKAKRLLTVLAAMLLSVGIANAQTDVVQGDDNGTPTNGVVQGDDNGTPTGGNTGETIGGNTDETTGGNTDETTGGNTGETTGGNTPEAKQNEKMPGDVDNNEKVNTDDVSALVDIIMEKEGAEGFGDVNGDKKANAADVTALVSIIMETDFFYLGTEAPTKDNYTTIDGVATNYKSIKEVLDAKLKLELLSGGERGFLLCPVSWDPKEDMVVQHENGSYYELTKAENNNISGYTLFKTEDIENDGTYVLKTIEAAEEYKKSLAPANPKYFWLGTYYPKPQNFPTVDGKEVAGLFTDYTNLNDAMTNASRDYAAGEYAVVLYPSDWGAKDDLVFLDAKNKKYYAVKKKDVTDFPDYIYYESTQKIGITATIKLSTETAAKAAGATLYEETIVTPVTPDPTPVTPDPTPVTPAPTPSGLIPGQAVYTGGNGITFVIHNNLGVEARFSGKIILNVSRNPNNWSNYTQANANMHGPTIGSSWAYNDIIIPAGGQYTSPIITTIDNVYPDYAGVNFTDGSWYFMNSDNGYAHAILLYTRIWNTRKNQSGGSNHMYVAAPPQNTKLLRGYTYHLYLYWINPEATIDPVKTGHYVILGYGKTGL